MKNKLTTALATSLCALGFVSQSNAQTTITGNLDIAFNAVSTKNTASGSGSYRGFGRESQINFANKGKLSNGMNYGAGFSLEIDGNEAMGSSAAITSFGGSDDNSATMENIYINLLLAPDTAITIGADHGLNSDVTLTNPVGFGYLGIQGVNNAGSIYPTSLNQAAFGIGIKQNSPIANLQIVYQPNPVKGGGSFNDTFHNSTAGGVDQATRNSRVELAVRGSLGVKGLDVLGAFAKEAAAKDAITTAEDVDGRRFAARYNFGRVTVAGDYIQSQGGNITRAGAAATTSQNHTTKGKSGSVSYAVDKDITVGYTRSVASASQGNLASGILVDEKVHMVALGYNLGPVLAQVQYRKGEGAGGASGLTGQGEIVQFRLGTRF